MQFLLIAVCITNKSAISATKPSEESILAFPCSLVRDTITSNDAGHIGYNVFFTAGRPFSKTVRHSKLAPLKYKLLGVGVRMTQ